MKEAEAANVIRCDSAACQRGVDGEEELVPHMNHCHFPTVVCDSTGFGLCHFSHVTPPLQHLVFVNSQHPLVDTERGVRVRWEE